MKEEKKISIYVKAALTFLVLFVLPLGSIYFLNAGREYRRTSIAELGDLGKVSPFSIVDQNGLPISPDVLRSRVAVVNFLSGNAETAKAQADRIAKLHQNFTDTEDVLFLSFIPADSTINGLERAKSLGINDHEQWRLVGTPTDKWADISQNIFKVKNPDTDIVLVDTSGTIRRHYDINNNPEMGRLVEHIAIVIPKQKRRGL